MNIKDIFKGKKLKKDKLLDISKAEKELLDVPKVVFEDLELQVTIGQWLGILSSQQGFGNSGFTVYTHLSAEKLMKKVNIPAQKFEEIVTKFGLLLKLAGVDNAETCTLDQFDKDNFSFNCNFNNSGNDANISLRWGDMIDFGPEFTINYQNESKTYNYWAESEEKPTRLKLQHYTIKNPENENSCYRYLSPYETYFTLTNGEYSFSIEIKRPESIKVDIFSDYVFRLENEEQLQQYLLGLTFPLEINEVYKKICEISTSSVNEYPSFKIEVKRKLDEKNNKTTDMVSLNHGQLKKFIITKGGRTITIDSDGNWSYNSPKLIVSQNDKGDIDYRLNSISSDEMLNAVNPYDQYNEVNQEVEQIRLLSKTILESKDN